MNKLTRLGVNVVCLFIVIINNAYSQNCIDSYKTAELLNQWRVINHIPAIVVTISKPNVNSRTFTSGYKSLRDKTLVTNHSLFQIGSITKIFISVKILQLEAQGKLSINDKIGKWFPQFPRWKNVKIVQLLNMTSGIPDYLEDVKFKNLYFTYPYKDYSNRELLDVAYNEHDYFPAGKGWHYSNTNYILAGLIIQKITRKSISDIISASFIRPLQLNNTYFYSGNIPKYISRNLAYGYLNYQDVTSYNLSIFSSAACMISNSEDIAKWIRDVFTKELPTKQLREFTQTCHDKISNEPENSAYGLGIFSLLSKQYGTIWWYSGMTYGYSAIAIWIPSQNTSISATINRLPNENTDITLPSGELFKLLLCSSK